MPPYANALPIKRSLPVLETLSFAPPAPSSSRSLRTATARRPGNDVAPPEVQLEDDGMDIDVEDVLIGIKEYRSERESDEMMDWTVWNDVESGNSSISSSGSEETVVVIGKRPASACPIVPRLNPFCMVQTPTTSSPILRSCNPFTNASVSINNSNVSSSLSSFLASSYPSWMG